MIDLLPHVLSPASWWVAPHPLRPDSPFFSTPALLHRRMSDSPASLDHTSPSPSPKPPLDASPKVQLPSIFSTFEDPFRRASLPSPDSPPHTRYRPSPYPPPATRRSHPASSPTYHFSPVDTHDEKPQRLSYTPYSESASSLPSAPASTMSSFASPDLRYGESDDWSPSAIARPSSTPSHPSLPAPDALRHASYSAPVGHPQLFSSAARISGQQDRRYTQKSDEWSFPNQEFVLPPSSSSSSYSAAAPPLSPPQPPPPAAAPPPPSPSSRPPQTIPTSTLVDRPTKKRGKLPKETTDYLKAWLHRHSDHPYPSEEEKKQLCHATGLSMSQVSNWMINVSRPFAPVSPAHAPPTRHAAGSWHPPIELPQGLPPPPRIPPQHAPRRPCPRCSSPAAPPPSPKSPSSCTTPYRSSPCPPPIRTTRPRPRPSMWGPTAISSDSPRGPTTAGPAPWTLPHPGTL